MSSLAEIRERGRARSTQTPPREDVRGGEGDPARPQRQGPHHGARPRADASDRGGEALRRADREVRGGARRAAVGLPQRRDRPLLPELRAHRRARPTAPRATVYEAIRALEAAGILTWVNRIARIREWGPDLFGRAQNRWRVIRTSATPTPSSIRNRKHGRRILLSPNFRLEPQVKNLFPWCTAALDAANSLHQALQRWGEAVKGAAPTGAARSLAV